MPYKNLCHPPCLVACATGWIFQATSKCGLAARSARDARWAPEPRTPSRTGFRSSERARALAQKWLRSGLWTRRALGQKVLARWPWRRSLAGLTYRSKCFWGQVHERLRAQRETRSERPLLGPVRECVQGSGTQCSNAFWAPEPSVQALSCERLRGVSALRYAYFLSICACDQITAPIKLPPQLSIHSVSNSDFGKRKFSSWYCTVCKLSQFVQDIARSLSDLTTRQYVYI